MLIILPLLCFLLIWTVLIIKSNKQIADLRCYILSAAVIWGCLLTAFTELLSAVKSILFSWVLVSWGISALALLCICLILLRHSKLRVNCKDLKLSFSEILLLIGIVLIVSVELRIALVAPPNTYDSMVYHMSRVMHWIQNRSVAFYPTYILRQLHQAPWAEYAIMHLQILSRGDHFANLIQWFSMLGSLVGVSLISKQLRADSHTQILTAVICATIPMGVLQASSTQNDYVVSFWLVCFVYSIMRLKTQPSVILALETGASLGLALLTKGTAYIYTFPFLVWWGFLGLKIDRTKFQKFWKYTLIVVIVALSINLPHYLRNVNLYKHPLGPGQEGSDKYSYVNKDFSVPAIVSNIIRNIALHIGTPSKKVNRMTEQALYRLLDNEVNNPFTTWGSPEFHISQLSYHEDSAGNPLHFVFIFFSLVIVVFLGYFRKVPDLAKYSLLLTSAFLLLCFYLRWQPWHSRLHLPLFVLWSPVIGIACSRISKSQRLLFFIGLLFIIAAFPWLLKNESRPLIKNKNILNTTRRDQYFVNFPYVRELYIGATNFIRERNIPDIGLILASNDYEYPIWILLQEKYDQTIQIRHVNVSNISSRLMTKEFLPNAIISTTIHTPEIQISKREYVNRWTTRLLYHSPHKFGKTQNITGTPVPSDDTSVNSQIYSVGKISVFIIKP